MTILASLIVVVIATPVQRFEMFRILAWLMLASALIGGGRLMHTIGQWQGRHATSSRASTTALLAGAAWSMSVTIPTGWLIFGSYFLLPNANSEGPSRLLLGLLLYGMIWAFLMGSVTSYKAARKSKTLPLNPRPHLDDFSEQHEYESGEERDSADDWKQGRQWHDED